MMALRSTFYNPYTFLPFSFKNILYFNVIKIFVEIYGWTLKLRIFEYEKVGKRPNNLVIRNPKLSYGESDLYQR